MVSDGFSSRSRSSDMAKMTAPPKRLSASMKRAALMGVWYERQRSEAVMCERRAVLIRES